MRRIWLVFVACVTGLVLAGAAGAKHPSGGGHGKVALLLGAIGDLGAGIDRGFERLLDELGELANSHLDLLGGQEEILGGQAEVQQEVQRLADLVGASILGAPDLLLVPVDGKMCRLVGPEFLIVRVQNLGSGDAVDGSSTSLIVAGTVAIPEAVPPLAVRDFHDVVFPRINVCGTVGCPIEVEVDDRDDVVEADEANNHYVDLACT